MILIPERLYGLGFFACLIYAKGDPIFFYCWIVFIKSFFSINAIVKNLMIPHVKNFVVSKRFDYVKKSNL